MSVECLGPKKHRTSLTSGNAKALVVMWSDVDDYTSTGKLIQRAGAADGGTTSDEVVVQLSHFCESTWQTRNRSADRKLPVFVGILAAADTFLRPGDSLDISR